jgi:5-methylcytosine-specific restriction protein A
MPISKKQIENAIEKYENGERPFLFREARSWFIVGAGETLYPLKYIYALATDREPASFNTSEPISELGKLNIKLLHLPKDTNEQLYAKVKKSSIDSPEKRAVRLKKARTNPKQKLSQIIVYERNPDVIADVLFRAKGKCEYCKCNAPFMRKKDNTPYLEVHHKKPLAKGGKDTVENAEALCPNCHRQKHYG